MCSCGHQWTTSKGTYLIYYEKRENQLHYNCKAYLQDCQKCDRVGNLRVYDEENERIVQRLGNIIEKKNFDERVKLRLILRNLGLHEQYEEVFCELKLTVKKFLEIPETALESMEKSDEIFKDLITNINEFITS